jgi:hypothetical protein
MSSKSMKMDLDHVVLQIAFLAEPFPASGHLAGERFFFSVDAEVVQKVVPALKLFAWTVLEITSHFCNHAMSHLIKVFHDRELSIPRNVISNVLDFNIIEIKFIARDFLSQYKYLCCFLFFMQYHI